MSSMQSYALTLDKFIDHAAKWHGDVEIVTGGGQSSRTDYAGLRRDANRLSGALLALGLSKGDRLATLAWNTRAHLEIWYAAVGVGIVCHTLNPRLETRQIAAMINQAENRVLAFGAGLAPMVAEIVALCPTIRHVVALDDPGCELESTATREQWTLGTLIGTKGEPVAWGAFGESSAAGLCFTSGTTGAPKGVLYTHRSSYLHTLRLLQVDSLALGADDSVLAAVPMFHANGWGIPFATPAVGAKLVLPGRDASGAGLARLIVEEQVTVAAGVPTVWLGLLDHLEATGQALPSLRRLFLGGAPLPHAVQRRIEERLGVTVHTSWGMTELSPLGTISSRGTSGTRPGSSGRPPIGLDLKLTDAEGRTLPEQRDVEGHLKVKGQSVVERYFGHIDAATDAEGWFDTGDLAVIGHDGDLSITGRAKDLIKSGGEWINPAEIEDIVGGIPGVALAAVIGRIDDKWGERPLLVIEPSAGPGIEDAALLDALRGRIANWWLPDTIIRVGRMPLASTGKIDKIRLRAEFGVLQDDAPSADLVDAAPAQPENRGHDDD